MSLLIAGRSMSPTLQVGDVVSLLPLGRPPRAGDILAFGADPVLCHRVLMTLPAGRGERWILHGGDHPGAALGLTRSESVIGRVRVAEDPRARRMTLRDVAAAGRLVVARLRTRLSQGWKGASTQPARGAPGRP